MPEIVRITDVSPRDGLQNEPGVVPTADKVTLIELLAAADVDEIEATSFVSPAWVPQLGDGEAVLTALRAGGVFGRDRSAPALSVLVPNEQGFARALGFHSAEFPLKIAVFTAASETFNKKNTNATIAESIARYRAFVPRASDAGMKVRLYVSCAIACPYEGKIEPAQVRRVCDELVGVLPSGALERGVAELDLGDTIGAGAPEDIISLLSIFDEGERASLVLHLHDTHGRAADCVRAGLDSGVRSFDGSVAGLGGCPFAGTKEKPAPGNISTWLLTRTIHEAGYMTGVDLDALARAAEFARRIVGRARGSAV